MLIAGFAVTIAVDCGPVRLLLVHSLRSSKSSELGIPSIFLDKTVSPTSKSSTAIDELGEVLIRVPSSTQQASE